LDDSIKSRISSFSIRRGRYTRCSCICRVTFPQTGLPQIGGLDGRQFLVILAGGIIGLVIIRYAANFFVGILHKKPGLKIAAFLIVGWVGVKISVYTLSHPNKHICLKDSQNFLNGNYHLVYVVTQLLY